jgi:hypothetical protein
MGITGNNSELYNTGIRYGLWGPGKLFATKRKLYKNWYCTATRHTNPQLQFLGGIISGLVPAQKAEPVLFFCSIFGVLAPRRTRRFYSIPVNGPSVSISYILHCALCNV